MTRESKLFFLGLFILIAAMIIVTYFDTFILGNFTVFTSEEEIPEYPDLFSEIRAILQLYVQ